MKKSFVGTKATVRQLSDKKQRCFFMNMHIITHTIWNRKIPCCLCAEISPESVLRRQTNRFNTEGIVQTKRNTGNGGRSLFGPYSYVAGDTAWISRKINGGRPQRQKPPFNIRTVSTSQPKIWVQRASRWYHRKNSRKNISEITPPQKKRGTKSTACGFYPA